MTERKDMDANGLSRLRKRCGMTQQEFAGLLGVAVTTISRYECGSRRIDDLKAVGIRATVNRFLMKRAKSRARAGAK